MEYLETGEPPSDFGASQVRVTESLLMADVFSFLGLDGFSEEKEQNHIITIVHI